MSRQYSMYVVVDGNTIKLTPPARDIGHARAIGLAYLSALPPHSYVFASAPYIGKRDGSYVSDISQAALEEARERARRLHGLCERS